MKKIAFLLGLLVFLFPSSAFAGSCQCVANYQNKPSDTKCLLQGNVSSKQGCTRLLGTYTMDQDAGVYSNCEYFEDNNCQGCGAEGLQKDPAGTVSCVVTNDCTAKTNGIGVAKCCSSECYFDSNGMQAYLNSRTGFSQIKLQEPKLEINIPGVKFTSVPNSLDEKGFLHIPFLAQYIAGVYKFAMGAASILAAIVIILNGFKISISMGGDQKNQAIQKIGQAIIGLCILWGSYLIFYTINPQLTQFRALQVQYVPAPPPENEDEVTRTTPVSTDLVTPYGDNLSISNNGIVIDRALLEGVQGAARDIKSLGFNLSITSGYRSLEKQLQIISDYCQNPAGSETCSPKPGKPTACILKGMKPENCPHTTGKAIDAWGRRKGDQCISITSCKSNPETDPCRKDPCQKAVIDAMRANGFCNIPSEAWHFEPKPGMSANCT